MNGGSARQPPTGALAAAAAAATPPPQHEGFGVGRNSHNSIHLQGYRAPLRVDTVQVRYPGVLVGIQLVSRSWTPGTRRLALEIHQLEFQNGLSLRTVSPHPNPFATGTAHIKAYAGRAAGWRERTKRPTPIQNAGAKRPERANVSRRGVFRHETANSHPYKSIRNRSTN